MQSTPLGYASGHEGLRRLAAHLRRPLPPGFVWDFASIDKCAVALARRVWPQFRGATTTTLGRREQARLAARVFGMKAKAFTGVFGFDSGQVWAYGRRSASEIKPTDVAVAIDIYLATGFYDTGF